MHHDQFGGDFLQPHQMIVLLDCNIALLSRTTTVCSVEKSGKESNLSSGIILHALF
jgi:hypothetical protein